jgi:hypothetical protein
MPHGPKFLGETTNPEGRTLHWHFSEAGGTPHILQTDTASGGCTFISLEDFARIEGIEAIKENLRIYLATRK